MARKQRIDSVTAHAAVARVASFDLNPPEHVPLSDKDAPFWRSVIAEKPKAEWTAHDLELAALLALSMRKLQHEDATLELEGSVFTTAGGNVAANPRCRIVADLHARVIKYRQSLGIHNRGKNGEQRDVEKRRSQASSYEADANSADDLIARPTVQ